MSELLSQATMAEFFIQSLVSHWFVAIVLVALVALFVTSRKSLNATTRHNIWLITLISFILMPLLVFMPKPSASVNLLDYFTPQRVEQASASPVNFENQNQIVNQSRINPNITMAPVNSSFTPNESMSSIPEFRAPIENTAIKNNLNFVALMKILFVLWGVGSLYLIRRLWGEYKAARELELQSDSVTPYFERRFADLCQRLDIKEKPLLRFHAGINAPMTVGMIRVWVAIPMAWREEIDDDIFDQTLTHELGHIARKDPLVNTVQRLLNIMFWMYPAVWYVSRQLELERESACDDWVLTHDGKGHTYANNLLNVAESLYLQPHVLAVGCLRSHSQLSRRIQNLLNKSSDHAVKNSWKLLAATTVGLLVTLSASAVIWPNAPQTEAGNSENTVNKFPGTQINFPAGQVQILLNGVDIQNVDAQVAHDPESVHVPPVPNISPKVISNFGGNTHNYSYSQNEKTHSNVMQTSNGKYGSGSLSIDHELGKPATVKVEPEMNKSSEPLLYAAWTGDWLEIKRLIKKGQDLNTVYKRPSNPRTAINAAILQSNLDMVEFLHEAGAELNSDGDWNHNDQGNALTLAAMVGNKDIAKYLVKKGARPDDVTMIVAVQSKNTELVDYLLKQDFKADESLVIIAIQNRDEEMLDVLIKHDVKIDDGAVIVAVQNRDKKIAKRLIKEVDEIDNGALVVAIQNHDYEMVDWLLEAGAEADGGALVIAVQNGDKKLVKRLLSAGADIDDGALVIAIQKRDDEMINWLLNAGADPDDGALVIAVQSGNKPLVKRLIKAGADIDDGALIIALQSRDEEMVQWLLDAGADADDGALIIAIQNKQTKMAKQLLDAGADIDDGALIVAIQSRDRQMVKWLLDAGAEVEDGAIIVAMQSGDKKIIELIKNEYKGDREIFDNGELEWKSKEGMEAVSTLENLQSLKNLDGLHRYVDLQDIDALENLIGNEIGNATSGFMHDLFANGGNMKSLALVQALEKKDTKLAAELLTEGAIPNTLHLIQALEMNESELASKILNLGAKPNALNILQAIENKEYGLAKKFIKHGAGVNGLVLTQAIETEDKALIKLVRSYMKENKTTEIGDNNFNKKTNYKSEEEHRASFSFTQWPVESNKISLAFNDSAKQFTGNDSLHEALDFPMPKGSQVKVVADGIVIEARHSSSFGNYILVDHGNAYFTKYANNKINKVSKGDHVNKGQVIALVGDDASMSSGPHLHFEVKFRHVKIDPETFLKPKT